MTEAKHPPPKASPPRQILDPAWEDELRAGQEQAGEAGGIDAELAALHLLRFARAPEALGEAALEEVWAAVAPAVAPPRPWWRRAWVLVLAPAAATAAVAVLVSGPGDAIRPDAAGPAVAAAGREARPVGAAAPSASAEAAVAVAGDGMARALEQQFAALEPRARRALGGAIDEGRAALRGELLAQARGGRS